MALIYCDGDNEVAKSYAKDAAEALVHAYPNHSWWVECRGGALIIKHMDASGARGTIGMVRHTSQLDHDAKARKREIMRAAGELLERAGLKRGANDGTPVKHMELDKDMQNHWIAPLHAPVVIH